MRLKLAVLVTLTSLATAQQKTKKLSPEFSKAAFKAVLAVINNPAGAVLDVTRMKDVLENVGVAASTNEEQEAMKAIQNLNAKCAGFRKSYAIVGELDPESVPASNVKRPEECANSCRQSARESRRSSGENCERARGLLYDFPTGTPTARPPLTTP